MGFMRFWTIFIWKLWRRGEACARSAVTVSGDPSTRCQCGLRKSDPIDAVSGDPSLGLDSGCRVSEETQRSGLRATRFAGTTSLDYYAVIAGIITGAAIHHRNEGSRRGHDRERAREYLTRRHPSRHHSLISRSVPHRMYAKLKLFEPRSSDGEIDQKCVNKTEVTRQIII